MVSSGIFAAHVFDAMRTGHCAADLRDSVRPASRRRNALNPTAHVSDLPSGHRSACDAALTQRFFSSGFNCLKASLAPSKPKFTRCTHSIIWRDPRTLEDRCADQLVSSHQLFGSSNRSTDAAIVLAQPRLRPARSLQCPDPTAEEKYDQEKYRQSPCNRAGFCGLVRYVRFCSRDSRDSLRLRHRCPKSGFGHTRQLPARAAPHAWPRPKMARQASA
jgi:hypothetical protein